MPTSSFGEESNTPTDVQIEMPPLHSAQNGYDKLASVMGLFPDVAIFRRFATMNVKNILYLQAELMHLEKQLDEAAQADTMSGDINRREYHRAWFALSRAELLPHGNGRQWKIFLQIREVLQQYNMAILQQKAMAEMDSPGHEVLSFMNEWMSRPSMGSVYLLERDRSVWKSTPREELLALDRSRCDDLLSKWMTNSATTWFHRAIGRHFKKTKPAAFMDNTVYYSQRTVSRFVSIIVVSLSSILPLVSIVLLSKIHKFSTRLWIIAACTVAFSLCLGLVASPKKVEIFSAAAAFAAVQVVFISGDGPSSSSPGAQ